MVMKQLEEQYKRVPLELKQLKRWVGYRIEEVENGKTTKRPYNVLSGARAKVNDSLTWSTFSLALSGVIKYNFDGIGFVLGNGIFGVDLDNHGDIDLAEFERVSKEFIDTLDTYTELSQSGKGIHIICKGKLPEGARRKGFVEMYDTNRFFVFTGNTIHNTPIQEREEEIKPLWEKYVYTPIEQFQNDNSKTNYTLSSIFEPLTLSDQDVIDNALKSKSGADFYRYYNDGDTTRDGGDSSRADMAFCNMLAFWCNKDKAQMDRIFRNSALMRDKWDQRRGQYTYGQMTIDKACSMVSDGFVKTQLVDRVVIKNNTTTVPTKDVPETDAEMNLNENGEPIFRIKKIYSKHTFSDTGNAMLFYEYFGDLFKYNVTDKIFMFWTGKTWIRDTTQIIRKYANKFIEILKEKDEALQLQIVELIKIGQIDEAQHLKEILGASQKNTARVSNKAGKDAMLSEFQSLFNVPKNSCDFDKDEYLLNTDSGIVDLRTGDILPWDKDKLMSRNTNVKVSFEKSTVWENFLFSIFDNGDILETNELIDSLQTCIGYSLTGSTREQVMFLLYGSGSNGKSTFTEQILKTLGTYADNIQSAVLMQQKGATGSSTFSIAKLQNTRFVETGETEDGGKLNESQIKILTGGDSISAQFKYGNEFSFRPKFKLWMSTNNKPIIRGNDFGIWRRILMFPFTNTFTGPQKDKSLPEKLEKDSDKILGWCIKGYLKYQELNGFVMPKTLGDAIKEYQKQMDVIAQFVDKICVLDTDAQIETRELYKAYKDWAEDNCEYIKKESQFSEDLKKKGITVDKNRQGITVYHGIRLAGVYIKNKICKAMQ